MIEEHCKWCRNGFSMWFNDRSEEHMLTRYSYRYSIEGDEQDHESFDVSTEQLLNLSENTQAAGVCVCVYGIMKHNGPNWSAHMLSRMLEQSMVYISALPPLRCLLFPPRCPSLLVTELLWSANQIRKEALTKNKPLAQNMCLFSLSLTLCYFVHFFHFVKLFNM